MLGDAACSSSDMLGRRQLTWLCPDASVENDNSVWTPGLSTNKCDVYFLHVFCNLFERIEAGCSFFFFPLQFFSVYYRSALAHSLATLKFKPDSCGQPGHGHGGPSETGDGGGDSDMPWSPTLTPLHPFVLFPVLFLYGMTRTCPQKIPTWMYSQWANMIITLTHMTCLIFNVLISVYC